MARTTIGIPDRIFMSYRREDTAYPASWLFDWLASRFGKDKVFKDVDSIQLGDDFVETITAAVGSCDVLLVLIGNYWLTVTDQSGRRRLDNRNDFVRLEIEAGLARDVRVIPILVGGAKMPDADEVPASLAGLVRRQALELSPDRFHSDALRLLRVLDTATTQIPAGPRLARTLIGPRWLAGGGWFKKAVLSDSDLAVFDVEFSPDGRLLASCGAPSQVRLWDPATGEQLRILKRGASHMLGVAFSPDGRVLASCQGDGNKGGSAVHLWHPVTGAHLAHLIGEKDRWLPLIVRDVAFSPDGRLLASSAGGAVRLWDPVTGALLRTLTGSLGVVNAMAFSPDGRVLASGGGDAAVRLWDPVTGAQWHTLTGHTCGVTAVAFSPDGRMLAGSGGGAVRLWDPVTGALLRTLTGHTGGVTAVAFSPDGRVLASGGGDAAVRLWDPVTGAQWHTLTGHTGGVTGVAFSPDGRVLASSSYDKTVRLWDLAPADR